ncbi:MAG TPA: PspC domain-containing protein [Tissierellaceae bacterium]|nr:PspC domain-containing protein [Tissierellaceae bacterium]
MNRLMRSKKDRVLSGVCGGIGEYFDIDSTIVRLVFLVLVFMSCGTALIVYLISSIIIPVDDGIIYQDDSEYDVGKGEKYDKNEKTRKNTAIFLGIGLVLWGGYLLTSKLFPGLFRGMRQILKLWPILLVILGLYVLIQQKDR